MYDVQDPWKMIDSTNDVMPHNWMESLGHISQPKPCLGQEGRKRKEIKRKKNQSIA